MILMQQIDFKSLARVQYLVGSEDVVSQMAEISALPPFNEDVLEFLNSLSKALMRFREYSDIITFAFWIRKASLLKFHDRFQKGDNENSIRLGRGLVFHIAPSNVPVNFAYSLVSAFLMGNTNIVRVPIKDFEQVRLITEAINTVLNDYPAMKSRIACVRYEHDKEVNDLFSSMCDCRIIWGGNKTIETLRQSPLQPRSTEITFADRYSLAVIDADAYIAIKNKERIAQDFYNDTFFSDQNACTSPRVVIWLGEQIAEAKKIFWHLEHELVKERYNLQPIQAVNKLTRAYLLAATAATAATSDCSCESGCESNSVHIDAQQDNLITRITLQEVKDSKDSIEFDNNSGYFYEYDCKGENLEESLLKIKPLCNDKRCQTVAYIGHKEMFLSLIKSGVKGIDRIVPIGQTMDFDLIWDGYNLPIFLSRVIILS